MDNSRFEEEFGINLFDGSTSIEKALEIGMEIEKEGKKFYSEKAAEARIPFVRHHLEKLVSDEDNHLNYLNEVKDNLEKSGKWKDMSDVNNIVKNLKNPEPFNKEFSGEIKDTSSSIEVLQKAMKMEERIRDFYAKLASQVVDENGKQFLESLSLWEQSHYNLIKNLLDAVMELTTTI